MSPLVYYVPKFQENKMTAIPNEPKLYEVNLYPEESVRGNLECAVIIVCSLLSVVELDLVLISIIVLVRGSLVIVAVCSMKYR